MNKGTKASFFLKEIDTHYFPFFLLNIFTYTHHFLFNTLFEAASALGPWLIWPDRPATPPTYWRLRFLNHSLIRDSNFPYNGWLNLICKIYVNAMSIWLALLMLCRPLCAEYKLVSDKEFVQFRDIKGVKNLAKIHNFSIFFSEI